MLHGHAVSVVVPTLNEAAGVRKVIAAVPKTVDEVVVVDGGSRDETREIAARCGATVVLEERKGYGRALRTGFERCAGPIIATTDGDGTYPVEILERIVGHLVAHDLDFISCSRFPLQEPRSMGRQTRFGNYLMTKAASLLWLHPFQDILSGMWVFRKPILEKLALYSDGWNLSEEIKLQAYQKAGPKFREFHIPYHERLGQTKLSPWPVGVENMAYMLVLRAGLVGWFKR